MLLRNVRSHCSKGIVQHCRPNLAQRAQTVAKRTQTRLVVQARAPGWAQKSSKGSTPKVDYDDAQHQPQHSPSNGFLPVEDHEARWMSNSPLIHSHAHEERPLTYAAAEEVYGRRPTQVIGEESEEEQPKHRGNGVRAAPEQTTQQAAAAIEAERHAPHGPPVQWRRDTFFCTFRWPASLKGNEVSVVGMSGGRVNEGMFLYLCVWLGVLPR